MIKDNPEFYEWNKDMCRSFIRIARNYLKNPYSTKEMLTWAQKVLKEERQMLENMYKGNI